MSELRVVRASGDGLARGLQIGSELRDLIGNSISFYHRYLDRRGVSATSTRSRAGTASWWRRRRRSTASSPARRSTRTTTSIPTWAVLFSMIADVERGRMWVAPGIPCEQEYQEIDLPELR